MLGDGIAFSLMVGVGESYLAAFALAVGFSDAAAGLVAMAPMFAGSLLQLATPAAVGWLGSHKRWVVCCAVLQSLTFVPLVAGALAGSIATWQLFVTVSLYWGLGMATSPAWSVWAETLVPRAIRASYFATRARWSHVAGLLGLTIGGLVLGLGRERDQLLWAFALIFGLALIARSVSAGFLARQSEQRPAPIGEVRVSPGAIRQHLRTGGHGRLLAYLLSLQLGVWIAAPYFTPYMLGPLGLDYTEFALLTGIAFIARIFSLPALGRLIRRSGTRRVLWLSSLGIVPLPVMWLVSDSFAWLVVLQLLGGVSWAAFELATLLSFFEHIPQHARTSVLSAYNLAYALAILVGSAIGALVLELAPDYAAAYPALLVLSTLARAASLRLLRGIRDVHPPPLRTPPLRTLGLRPSAGAVQRPVLAALPEPEGEID